MSEKYEYPPSRYDQLQFLYMQDQSKRILERFNLDPAQFVLTPQGYNLGFPLSETRPKGLDVTNSESGKRIYITGYTEPEKEVRLQQLFDLHNNNPDRKHSYPFFVLNRMEKHDPYNAFVAYHLPKGIMPFDYALASPLISDQESEMIKKNYGRVFRTYNIIGQQINSRDFSFDDIAVLLSDAQDDQSVPKRGIYTIPRAYINPRMI